MRRVLSATLAAAAAAAFWFQPLAESFASVFGKPALAEKLACPVVPTGAAT